MRGRIPFLQSGDLWNALRTRALATVRVLVSGASPERCEALARTLRDAGHQAEAVTLQEAPGAILTNPPDLRLVFCRGDKKDPALPLLKRHGRHGERPAVGLFETPSAASAALAAGADDVIPASLPIGRLVSRVQARLRGVVVLRVLDELSTELKSHAQKLTGGARAVAALDAHIEAQREWMLERGERVLLAWSGLRDAAREIDLLAQQRVAVLTAESAEEVREIMMVAGVDAVVIHGGLPGGAAAAVAAARLSDQFAQVALIETAGTEEEVDRALAQGAIAALRVPELPDASHGAIVRGLLEARANLAILENVLSEIGTRVPQALVQWRADRARDGHLAAGATAAATRFAEPPVTEAPAKEASGAERRKDARMPVELPMLLLPRRPVGDVREGSTINLSLGGAFVVCERPLDDGTEIECKVSLGATTVYLEGVVLRTAPGVDAKGRPVRGMAIRFDRIEPATLRRLVEVVRAQVR